MTAIGRLLRGAGQFAHVPWTGIDGVTSGNCFGWDPAFGTRGQAAALGMAVDMMFDVYGQLCPLCFTVHRNYGAKEFLPRLAKRLTPSFLQGGRSHHPFCRACVRVGERLFSDWERWTSADADRVSVEWLAALLCSPSFKQRLTENGDRLQKKIRAKSAGIRFDPRQPPPKMPRQRVPGSRAKGGSDWSERDNARLIELRSLRISKRVIAKNLGKTLGAVSGRISRLGLTLEAI